MLASLTKLTKPPIGDVLMEVLTPNVDAEAVGNFVAMNFDGSAMRGLPIK